jgi:surface protein
MSKKKTLFFSSQEAVALGVPLIMEVDTTDTSSAVSASDSIILPFDEGNTVNLQIDWGDGSALEPYTNTNNICSHQYSIGGLYDIKIYNLNGVSRIPWNITNVATNRKDFSKFYDLKQFGDCEIYQLDDTDISTFLNCINLDITATDIAERCIDLCVNVNRLFTNCSIVQAKNSANWDTSNIINFEVTFQRNLNINIDCSNWEMSQVETIYAIFNECAGVNPDVTNWDISSSCIDISIAFQFLTNFNRNLSNWDVSGVETMSFTFRNCTSFTGQGLDTWSTLALTNLQTTFQSCINFNQDLSGWDFSNVTDMTNWGNAWGMDTNNYDKLLLSFASQTLQPNLTNVIMSSKYTAGEVTNGVTDGVATNKLIDSTQNFTSTVNVGDIIKKASNYAEVVTVNSNTELTLDADIMALGNSYSVEGSNVAKARYFVVKTYNWQIIDNGQA